MSKTIEEQMLLLKESFDAVGTKLNGLTWQRIENSHLEFSQSQTQKLKEQNSELVDMLEYLYELTEYFDEWQEEIQKMNKVLTKHNHLKSNTNETDKI